MYVPARRVVSHFLLALLYVSSVLIVAPQPSWAAGLSACEKTFAGKPVLQKRCKKIEYVGHRGRHYEASTTNENTLKALAYDKSIGAGCETDTWPLASDTGVQAKGVGVILHDETLKRTVSAESIAAAGLTPDTKIEDVTFAQFKILRTKGGEPLPTLKEWVTYTAQNKIACRIEIKWGSSDSEMRTLGKIIRDNSANAYVSFYGTPNKDQKCSTIALDRILDDSQMDDIVVGLKQPAYCPKLPQYLAARGFSYVTVTQAALNKVQTAPNLVSTYHRVGLKVGNNNSGGASQWANDVKANVDFIISGNPGALKKWLRG